MPTICSYPMYLEGVLRAHHHHRRVAWLFVLAQQSRRAAEAETRRQTTLLIQEIDAHKRTDAELQRAKEVAESANLAKSGMSSD